VPELPVLNGKAAIGGAAGGHWTAADGRSGRRQRHFVLQSAAEDNPCVPKGDSHSDDAMASRKKRPRGGREAEAKPLEEQETAASLRARLLHRIDGTPSFWADIEARLGTTGVDAGLCALGREVADVIRTVGESAEAERQHLQSLRTTLHIAVDARVNELLENITTAESAKIAALERELERLDAALERTRREHAAAREALKRKSDDEIAALSAALTVSLDGIDALLATLPHGPVEPSLLRLELDEGALLSSIRTAGTVLAPRGVHAVDVVVRGLPTHVRPGRPLQFELALCDDYPCRAPAELEAAAASLAFHARVVVSLEAGAESQPMQATLVPAVGVVAVSVAIPESAGRGAEVVVSSVTVAGQPVSGGQLLQLRLQFMKGIHAPLLIKGAANEYACAPVITRDGTLNAPLYESADVMTFSANGTPLPVLPFADFGLSTETLFAAFVEATGTLLLADYNADSSKLVAVDAASRAVRWSAALGGNCFGIAVLPAQEVVVVSDYTNDKLHVHRLSDGVRVASAEAARAAFVSADPASRTVYVSTGSFTSCEVSAFRWDGAALVAEGVLEAAGTATTNRPLAVMPPTPGRHTSYLVVGTFDEPTLLVLSLPDRRLVHKHTLEGTAVMGLAADPSGTAIAVCDAASEAIHVLPWLLPGMLPLQ
jgi:hypothetical protein